MIKNNKVKEQLKDPMMNQSLNNATQVAVVDSGKPLLKYVHAVLDLSNWIVEQIRQVDKLLEAQKFILIGVQQMEYDLNMIVRQASVDYFQQLVEFLVGNHLLVVAANKLGLLKLVLFRRLADQVTQ